MLQISHFQPLFQCSFQSYIPGHPWEGGFWEICGPRRNTASQGWYGSVRWLLAWKRRYFRFSLESFLAPSNENVLPPAPDFPPPILYKDYVRGSASKGVLEKAVSDAWPTVWCSSTVLGSESPPVSSPEDLQQPRLSVLDWPLVRVLYWEAEEGGPVETLFGLGDLEPSTAGIPGKCPSIELWGTRQDRYTFFPVPRLSLVVTGSGWFSFQESITRMGVCRAMAAVVHAQLGWLHRGSGAHGYISSKRVLLDMQVPKMSCRQPILDAQERNVVPPCLLLSLFTGQWLEVNNNSL